MAYTVLFPFILLASTLSVGIGKSTYPDRCIINMSSRYSSVSQYCISKSTQKIKEPVCKEIFELFDAICLFNISSTAFPLPEPHTVSKDNCVLLCADIDDMKYVSDMIDGSIHKCTTLCAMDSEAVAVFLTLFQLKDFIAALENASVPKLPNEESTAAEIKPKEEHSATAINSTEQLQQSSSSSKAVVNASAPIEPNVKSPNVKSPNVKSTYAGENDSTPKEADITSKPVSTVATEKKSTTDVKPTTTVATEKKSTTDVKPSTTAAALPSSTKSTKMSNTTTVVTEKKTTPDLKPASTDATEKKTTPNVKPASTAAGENYLTPKEADITLKPVITAEGENDSTPKEADITLKPVIAVATDENPAPGVKPTTTVATDENPAPGVKPTTTDATQKKPAPDVKPTIKEHDEADFDKTDISDGLDYESEETNEDVDESDNNDELSSLPKSTLSKTDEKDETSRLDDTPSSYHFLIYFLAFIVLCVAAYIAFHNKHKIIAFIIEGKQGRRGGRPSTKQYTPLKSKVEDVMPFIEKSTTQSNYIY